MSGILPNVEMAAQVAADAIAAEDALRRAEQATLGVDGLDEVDLHPVIEDGFLGCGLGVVREARYPGDSARPATDAARDRCDLVVLERAGLELIDPVRERREIERGAGTLFGGVAADLVEGGRSDGAVSAEDAAWIEVKAVGQHVYRDGVPGPNGAYASELVRGPALDAAKLADAEGIGAAFLLVVLFSEDERVARHDLSAMVHTLLDQGLPMGSAAVEWRGIDDRIGNTGFGVCAAVVRRGALALGFE